MFVTLLILGLLCLAMCVYCHLVIRKTTVLRQAALDEGKSNFWTATTKATVERANKSLPIYRRDRMLFAIFSVILLGTCAITA